ncbi:hypothetical protein EIN_012990, partial [Entamoeba invadens IP1]
MRTLIFLSFTVFIAFSASSDECLTTVDKCTSCKTDDPTKCEACEEGYYVKDEKCTACSDNCYICTDANTCYICKIGYYKDDKSCKKCSTGCSKCTA